LNLKNKEIESLNEQLNQSKINNNEEKEKTDSELEAFKKQKVNLQIYLFINFWLGQISKFKYFF
jgi:hypothetical protein